jgi:hypothetical protein
LIFKKVTTYFALPKPVCFRFFSPQGLSFPRSLPFPPPRFPWRLLLLLRLLPLFWLSLELESCGALLGALGAGPSEDVVGISSVAILRIGRRLLSSL